MSEDVRVALKKRFQDFRNYPYGFSRSGDFSIKESQLLEQHGRLMAALADGILIPENEEETRLLSVIRGEIEPLSAVESVWMKYQKRINRPHVRALSAKNDTSDVESEDVALEDDDE